MVLLSQPQDMKNNAEFRVLIVMVLSTWRWRNQVVTVAGLLNIAQYLVDVEDAEFDPTSSTLKSLFNPLPNDISGLWERCCDLTLVGRSIVSKKSFVLHVREFLLWCNWRTLSECASSLLGNPFTGRQTHSCPRSNLSWYLASMGRIERHSNIMRLPKDGSLSKLLYVVNFHWLVAGNEFRQYVFMLNVLGWLIWPNLA